MIILYMEGATVRQVCSAATLFDDAVAALRTFTTPKSDAWFSFSTELGRMAVPVDSIVAIRE